MRHSSSVIRHSPFVIVLVAYLTLAVAYSLASPLYEPSDEIRHVRYVRHISAYRSLPVQGSGGPRAQSHHPPLYYALGALVSGWVPGEQDVYYSPPTNPFWGYRSWEVNVDNKNQYLHGPEERFPFHGVALTVYLVRWMTVLIGAGVVWLTYRLGREVFPERPALAAGGAALVAFNPQFIYMSGSVINDVPAALCGVAVLLACVRLVRRGPSVRADVTLGVLYGLALLTKFNLLISLALIELAYVLAIWRDRDWRAFLRGNAIILGLAAAISGWWFWRNWRLYGDPTGMKMVNELWSGRSPFESWWALRQGWWHLWSSLWGRFGYGQLPLPKAVYRGVLALCACGLAGYLVPRRRSPQWMPIALLVADVVLFVGVVAYYILIQPAGAMGRFLFPCLPAFAVLVAGGIARFFPDRLSWLASTVVTFGMAALAVYALLGVLHPAFAPPPPLSDSAIKAIPNPIDVSFGPAQSDGSVRPEYGVVRLLGYRVSSKIVKPGGELEVTLYWRALKRTQRNHVVFVHLLSEVGTMIAQRDTYPGLGRYPTTTWDPGVTFADTYRVHVPETAYAPDRGYVQVGLYLPDGPRLVTDDGRDALRLVDIEVRPRPGEYANPLHVNFDDKIALVGYELAPRVASPGETIHLTLYWKTLAPMKRDYRAFAHVLGSENQIWANSDSLLREDNTFTSQWQPGKIVKESRELTVGETTPPNFYDIEVGLHAPGEGRLKILAEDGHRLGSRQLLCKVQVTRDE